jgi:hypothetical protein
MERVIKDLYLARVKKYRTLISASILYLNLKMVKLD